MGQMKILVVDDEKLLVKGIKFNLEQDGYAVVTAFDGEEAIRLAHDESIDLILLDLMLPKVDGFTVCRTIRSFSNVPIIMVTAKSEDIDKMVKGLMIESYIEDGCQSVNGNTYGQSITDPCLGWEKTESLIYEIAESI